MKLTLTYAEVEKMIRNRYDISPSDTLIIQRKPAESKNPEHQKALNLVKTIKKYKYLDVEKIAAIKKFRELTGENLYNSKWAIENFDQITTFVRNFKRIPTMNGTEYSGGVILS